MKGLHVVPLLSPNRLGERRSNAERLNQSPAVTRRSRRGNAGNLSISEYTLSLRKCARTEKKYPCYYTLPAKNNILEMMI